MPYCSKCGSGNPDDGVYCWNCGEKLFVEDRPEPVPEEETPTYQAEPEVDAVENGDGTVTLKRTSDRNRDRQISMVLAVATTVAVLAVLFLLELELDESISGFVFDTEDGTFLDIAEDSPLGFGIQVFLVITVIMALLGLMSCMFGLLSVVPLTITAVLAMIPFDITFLGSMVHFSVTASSVVIFVVLDLIVIFLAVLSRIYMQRSVTLDGKVCAQRDNGFRYNIDKEWNTVRRERGPWAGEPLAPSNPCTRRICGGSPAGPPGSSSSTCGGTRPAGCRRR